MYQYLPSTISEVIPSPRLRKPARSLSPARQQLIDPNKRAKSFRKSEHFTTRNSRTSSATLLSFWGDERRGIYKHKYTSLDIKEDYDKSRENESNEGNRESEMTQVGERKGVAKRRGAHALAFFSFLLFFSLAGESVCKRVKAHQSSDTSPSKAHLERTSPAAAAFASFLRRFFSALAAASSSSSAAATGVSAASTFFDFLLFLGVASSAYTRRLVSPTSRERMEENSEGRTSSDFRFFFLGFSSSTSISSSSILASAASALTASRAFFMASAFFVGLDPVS